VFNRWARDVAERFHGGTCHVVSARTLLNHRKGLYGSTRLTPKVLAAKVAKCLPEAEPPDVVERRFQYALGLPGILSVLVSSGIFGLQDDHQVVTFAAELDRLSARLEEFWDRQDIPSIKDELLDSALLGKEVWTLGGKDLQSQLIAACNLTDLQPVLAGLAYGLFLSTFALLDACFTARAFGAYQPVPLFLLLAPRPKLDTEVVTEQSNVVLRPPGLSRRGFRDIIDTPMVLFFGMVTALSMLRNAGGGGNWPDAPRRRDARQIFKEAHEKEFDKLRYGEKRLTVKVLERCLGNRFLPEFWMLLFVAHAWEAVLLRRQSGPAGKPISALVPDDDYLPLWESHGAALRAQDGAAQRGTIPWPGYLLRVQLP
jgi:hypothetical protein